MPLEFNTTYQPQNLPQIESPRQLVQQVQIFDQIAQYIFNPIIVDSWLTTLMSVAWIMYRTSESLLGTILLNKFLSEQLNVNHTLDSTIKGTLCSQIIITSVNYIGMYCFGITGWNSRLAEFFTNIEAYKSLQLTLYAIMTFSETIISAMLTDNDSTNIPYYFIAHYIGAALFFGLYKGLKLTYDELPNLEAYANANGGFGFGI